MHHKWGIRRQSLLWSLPTYLGFCLTYALTQVHLAPRLMRNLPPLNKHDLLGSRISKETGLQAKPDTLLTLRNDLCASLLRNGARGTCCKGWGGLDQVRDLLKVWLMVCVTRLTVITMFISWGRSVIVCWFLNTSSEGRNHSLASCRAFVLCLYVCCGAGCDDVGSVRGNTSTEHV